MSECSELDTYRGNTIENGGCLLASERSERDSIRGGNAKSSVCYMYICMCGWYVCPLNACAGNFIS